MKKLFGNIWNWVKKAFGNAKKAEQFIEDHVDDAIAVVSKILQYANNPLLFVSLIQVLPEKYKNAAIEDQQKLVNTLLTAAKYLGILDNCFHLNLPYEKILCLVNAFTNKSEEIQNKNGLALASRMIRIEKPDMPESVADHMIVSRIAERKVASLMAIETVS